MNVNISWMLEDEKIDDGFIYDTLADLYHQLNLTRQNMAQTINCSEYKKIMAGKRYLIAKDLSENVIARIEWDSTKRSIVNIIDKLEPAYLYIEGTFTGTNDNGFTRFPLDVVWSELAWVVPMGYETPIDKKFNGIFI